MSTETMQAARLVAALDQNHKLPLDRIPADDIAKIADRIAPREPAPSGRDVAAFNSAI